eukprot:TRINITY_DN232_c0_g1_i1.p1 TRINITY_DN232_c0_g1~~TRINITY_DN232_c0_g1_i1.p1  ORF type:complete len:629 (-),score=73.35 TRINITY_DN232_c0_g1_i1:3307-5193(-)
MISPSTATPPSFSDTAVRALAEAALPTDEYDGFGLVEYPVCCWYLQGKCVKAVSGGPHVVRNCATRKRYDAHHCDSPTSVCMRGRSCRIPQHRLNAVCLVAPEIVRALPVDVVRSIILTSGPPRHPSGNDAATLRFGPDILARGNGATSMAGHPANASGQSVGGLSSRNGARRTPNHPSFANGLAGATGTVAAVCGTAKGRLSGDSVFSAANTDASQMADASGMLPRRTQASSATTLPAATAPTMMGERSASGVTRTKSSWPATALDGAPTGSFGLGVPLPTPSSRSCPNLAHPPTFGSRTDGGAQGVSLCADDPLYQGAGQSQATLLSVPDTLPGMISPANETPRTRLSEAHAVHSGTKAASPTAASSSHVLRPLSPMPSLGGSGVDGNMATNSALLVLSQLQGLGQGQSQNDRQQESAPASAMQQNLLLQLLSEQHRHAVGQQVASAPNPSTPPAAELKRAAPHTSPTRSASSTSLSASPTVQDPSFAPSHSQQQLPHSQAAPRAHAQGDSVAALMQLQALATAAGIDLSLIAKLFENQGQAQEAPKAHAPPHVPEKSGPLLQSPIDAGMRHSQTSIQTVFDPAPAPASAATPSERVPEGMQDGSGWPSYLVGSSLGGLLGTVGTA